MSDCVHIVCLDAPSPPDYGGGIDMYFKVKALASIGRKIILHYFHYRADRGVQGLEEFCVGVHAYKRKGPGSLSVSKPYLVSSRVNKELIERLNRDDYPILLEGIHCSGLIPYLKNKNRVVVRLHNEEAGYYRRLAATEKSIGRKIYFRLESLLVKNYYKTLSKEQIRYASLSTADIEIFKNQYALKNQHFIPCFIPWQEITSLEGMGDYCLYHGNMGISENEAAAAWLIKKIFRKTDLVLVIAGKNISNGLKSLVARSRNIKLINNPSMEELNALIRDAHINVLPSMNTTGVKLKLLHALFEGRFCVTNTEGLKGSGIEQLADVANEEESFREKILELYKLPFEDHHKKNRQQLLAVYDNIKNAEKLSGLL
jgi:glycosyltransferase involved in cell wall biosynthesis